METAKISKKKGPKASEKAILKAYRLQVLNAGQRPASVFKFCADAGITETEFYSWFASFEALEKSIWKNYADEVISAITGDAGYPALSAREKTLSFYFAMVEVLRADRSFVLYQMQQWKNPAVVPGYMKLFKESFDRWVVGVISSGKETGEIARRPLLDTRYDNLCWLHTLFILRFWCRDDSTGFEKTDAAIEKSVHLAFDLIGKGILDNALDFGKFLYQNARN